MTASLDTIVQTYLNDTEYLDEQRRITQSRDNSLPTLRKILVPFIEETIDLRAFREQIDKALSPPRENWGARGTDFLMELNKLVKYHTVNADGSINPEIERELRSLLTGLNAQAVGQRIGRFYTFLQQERERFRQEGRPRGTNVSPGNSAIIISLFARWLDWTGKLVIYYVSVRRGLKLLLDAGLLPQAEGLRIKGDGVVVQSDTDHQAVMQALDSLAVVAPQLKLGSKLDWAEDFLLWISMHPDVFDAEAPGESAAPIVRIIEHGPLAPTPEPRLSELIAELRRHILIDEKLVRRIYHALLAGHVILTGPPGTGKTELARLIPEILWREQEGNGQGAPTAYTTQLITATDEWSVRTLIGGLAPLSVNGQVVYRIQYGYLTEAIRKNWASDASNPKTWRGERISVYAPGAASDGRGREFRGLWLVIDEFNRAPIDIALGEALTALSDGNGGVLRVPADDGTGAELPLPRDFRIIGTLNSFDRNYLNQISEALKRRFSFIEVPPPPRSMREAEQGMVLYKALQSIGHLVRRDDFPDPDSPDQTVWMYSTDEKPFLMIEHRDSSGLYRTYGRVQEEEPDNVYYVFERIFYYMWRVFEIVRIYRSLGTAQAIALTRQLLINGIVQRHSTLEEWSEDLDAALCDTLADQLQVLMPDELEALYCSIQYPDAGTFVPRYNEMLGRLVPRRRRAQLEALGSVRYVDGNALLSEDEIERLAEQAEPQVSREVLKEEFRLDEGRIVLPQFARRLRTFKAERGL